ncbi:MAG: T9SS type A sorting domain-containing protein [Bacteroidia bacterium]|nr:T9SS type A sorting domain-containing protein [Bacteroidia bacterium]
MKKATTILVLMALFAANSLSAQLRFAGRVHAVSREYHHYPDQWAAYQMLGMPDVYPTYDDAGGAWTPSSYGDQRDWVELDFDNAGPVDSILIWETYTPGYIDTVYVQNAGNGNWLPVYTHFPSAAPQVSRILRIGFQMTNFNVSRVRIAIANDLAGGYPEIDAVALHPASNPNLVLSNAIGTAVNLDGVDDEYHTNTPIENAFTSAFTMMAWVKPMGTANNVLYGQYGGAIVSDSYHSIFTVTVANTGGGDSLYLQTLGSVSGVVSMPYSSGNWMHIAMVQTADSLIGYQNGLRVGAVNSVPPTMAYYSFSLGKNDDSGEYFEGQVDELKSFNRALSAVEVANQQNLVGNAAITTGLTGYWQFNEGSGTGHYNAYNHITDSLLYGASYVQAGFVVAVDPLLAPKFQLFPNPTTGLLQLRGDLHQVTAVQMLDLAGRVLTVPQTKGSVSEITLDLNSLPAGMYLARVQGRQFTYTEKVILK